MSRTRSNFPSHLTPHDYEKAFREGCLSNLPQSPTGGAPSTTAAPSVSEQAPPSTTFRPQCSYATSDGRRCRMFRSPDHPEFCDHHARKELRSLDREPVLSLAAEILSITGEEVHPETGRKSKGALTDFRSAAAINAALGNVFVQLADGRLDTRRAAVLTYIAQGMFQTLKKLGWEGTNRSPSPNLEKALKAVLKARKPGTEAAKFAHAVLTRAADSG